MQFNFRQTTWLLIFITAYLVRLLYIVEISDRPYFTEPAVDAEYHDNWAQDIAEGKLGMDEPFFRAPLYPYLLGGIYAVFGHDYFAVRIIQALIGSFTCVLVYLLGKKLFSYRIGAIAGFAAALTGIFIYFEAELLIPVILLPLDLGFILLLLKAEGEDKSLYWWLAGLLFGLSAVARPNIIIVVPLVVYVVLRDKRFRRAAGRLALVVLGFIIPLAPVAYHNLRAGEFALIATQGGVNFYIGNNRESNGATAEFPGLGNIWRYVDAAVKAEEEAGKELTSTQVSDFYYCKGLNFIIQEPNRWLRLMLNKGLLYLSGIEISNNKNIYFAAQDSLVLTALLGTVGYRVFAPLGFLGLIVLYRRSWGNKFLFWFVLLYSLSVLAFFITSRYRLPIIPFLIIFSAAMVEWFYQKIRQGNFNQLIIPAIALLGLAVIVNSNWLKVQKISPVYSHFSLGNAYAKKGKTALAEEEYLKALAADPNYPQVHLNIGVIYYDRGDYARAEQEFFKEIEINHGFESAYAFNNLGNIRVRQGKYEEALHFYRTALRIYPDYPDGKINLARTYSDLGMFKIQQDSLEAAKNYLQLAVETMNDEPMYRYNYGLVLGELEDEQSALEQMRTALELNPNFSPAQKVIDAYEEQMRKKD